MEFVRWIYILAVITSIKCAVGQKSNLTLLVEKNNSYNFTCISEGDALKSALVWIAPIEYSKNSIVSHYLPPSNTIHDYRYQTEAKDIWIPSGWHIDWSTAYYFKPLTDHRWESLETFVVRNETTYLIKFQESTFSTALSFQMQTNVTLYLCQDSTRLGCYVISINPENLIVSYGTSLDISSSSVPFNSDNGRWNDIIILHTYKSHRSILELKFPNKTYSWPDILELPLSSPVQHLFVHSNGLSLWKLHVYPFLSVNRSIGKRPIGPNIPVSPGMLCISMNIALCSTCVMHIAITNERHEEIINQEVFSKKLEHINQTKESGRIISWKEVKIIKENVNNTSLFLYLSTTISNNTNSESRLWAIDNIRFCDPKEIRVSTLRINHSITPEVVACHVRHEAPISISNNLLSRSNCKNPQRIGAHCNITCASIFGENKKYCDRNIICSRNNIDYNNNNCFCADGYTGVTCENECPKGKRGLKCGNNCENCKNNQCNVNNGTCTEGCNTGFTAPTCTKPEPITYINTVRKTVNTITIEWNEIVSPEKLFSYIIHFKHKKYHYCKDDTHDAKVQTVIMTNTRIAVQKLLPFSDYSFEIAAIYNNITGDFIHYIETTSSTGTPGDEELPVNFIVQQNEVHNLPLILLTEPPCTKIKGNLTYNIKFECSNDWCKDSMSTEVVFTNNRNAYGRFAQSFPLTAFSNYTAVLIATRIGGNSNPHRISSQFQTLVHDPPQVRNLTIYSKNESSISLRWRAPYPPYGELHQYQIQWNVKDNLHKSINSKPCYLWEDYTCADIRNLKENYTYTISVMAKNKGLKTYGKERFEYNIVTRQAEPKPPKSVKVNWEGDVPVLEWDHPFITNGPLIGFYIEISVIESEYTDHRSFYDVPILRDNQTYHYKMSDLKPCSIYNISVLAMNKFKSKPSRNVTIVMPPPVPTWGDIKISCLELICEVNISKLTNISSLSYLFVVVNNTNSNNELKTIEAQQILHILKDNQTENAWLAVAKTLHHNASENIVVVVGNETTTFSEYGGTTNEFLQNNTNYVITVIVENQYLRERRYSEPYTFDIARSLEVNVNNQVNNVAFTWYFLFLLILVPFVIGVWIACKKKSKSNEDCRDELPNRELLKCKGRTQANLPLYNLKTKPTLSPMSKNKDMEEDDEATKLLLPHSRDQDQFMHRNTLEDAEGYLVPTFNSDKEVMNLEDAEGYLVPTFNSDKEKHLKPTLPTLIYDAISSNNKNATNALSKPVRIIHLKQYVEESIRNGELERQYEMLPRGPTKSWSYGELDQNQLKNRYNNIIAYDHNRVRLENINDDPYSDYINASYIIEGYNISNQQINVSTNPTFGDNDDPEYCYVEIDDSIKNSEESHYSYIDSNYLQTCRNRKTYIATQNPKASTISDFWRMIWQENVEYIINLSNEMKNKPEQYWPDAGECSLDFRDIRVKCVVSKSCADYKYRTFTVSQNNIERTIEQIHFTSWPKHGVPSPQGLVALLPKLLDISRGMQPIVVHCRDGINSTAVLILCDLCLKMASVEKEVDILKLLYNLREQRVNSVNSLENYKLVHLVILEYLLFVDTKIKRSKETISKMLNLLSSNILNQQFQNVNETKWIGRALMAPQEIMTKPEWSIKNRFENIIPSACSQVYLTKYPAKDECSDYINAVIVDGFKRLQQFIVTQQPLNHTVPDFWRMIDEFEITSIVSLNRINLDDETSCLFLPTSENRIFEPLPFLTVKFKEIQRNDYYNTTTIIMYNQEKNNQRTIHFYAMKGWGPKQLIPDSEQALLQLWEKVNELEKGKNPIVVTCYDGAKACGLFVTLAYVIEKIIFEQEVDICSAIKNVRLHREQFITDMEQFLFLHRVVIKYLRSFQYDAE